MAQAEMDCCKKMAGNCNMGAGKHPCCKTVATAPSHSASMQAKVQFQPVLALLALVPDIESVARTDAEASITQMGLPPPSPPGTDSILRI
jgi:hypothetical protein